MKKKLISSILGGILIIGLFLLVSYYIQNNTEKIKDSIEGYETLGIFIYILALIISIVIAPVSVLPLIPIASNIYGWFFTGIMNYIGWFLGSVIAFFIAKRYGKPIVKRFVSLQRIKEIEDKIPKKNKFFSLIFLRIIAFPADVFSYALGLFTDVSWKLFLATTAIGELPFSFILAYLGDLDIKIQIIIFVVGFLLWMLITYLSYKKYKL